MADLAFALLKTVRKFQRVSSRKNKDNGKIDF